VSETVTVEQVQESIVRTGGALIADVDLFDEYADTDGRQSYGFRIAYQAADRTLTGKEVAEIHNQIVQQLHDDLGADLRE
jgi:phenylalanyl-tRNA synthetase beta chain